MRRTILEKPGVKIHSGDVDVYGGIILKKILETQFETMETRSNWLL